MKLDGKNLEVISITRKQLIDSHYVCMCENCGKDIVNIAIVINLESTETYNICLDCKKTLIDKKVIDSILLENKDDAEYRVKDFEKKTNEVVNFLNACSVKNNEIIIYRTGYIRIKDKTKINQLGEKGLIIYSKNLGYLYSQGLIDFIEALINKGKITFK